MFKFDIKAVVRFSISDYKKEKKTNKPGFKAWTLKIFHFSQLLSFYLTLKTLI